MSIFYYTDRRVNGQDFESGAIANVYYDTDDNRLGVEFNKGFNVYVYDEVPESVFGLFVEADSLHQFYTNFIQSRFGESTQYSAVTKRDSADHADENAWQPVEQFAPVIPIFEPNSTLDDLIEQANSTSRYGVKWVGSFNSSDERMGPFEYLTDALNENDAVAEFLSTAKALHGDAVTAKIVSVTHYFE